jgi:hypothetical protein
LLGVIREGEEIYENRTGKGLTAESAEVAEEAEEAEAKGMGL